MTQYDYTVNWEEAEEPKGSLLWLAIFLVAFIGFALLAWTLLGSGFGTDAAARLQAYVDLTRGGNDYLAQNFAAIYPVIPYLLSLLFSHAPQVADTAPYFVDAFAAATLLGAGFFRLTKSGTSIVFALIFVILVAANPVFLFVATSGSGIAVALLFVYMFCLGSASLARDASVRGLIMISLAYAGLLLSTSLGLYFFIITVPILALTTRQQMVEQAPLSFFLVLAFVPLAIIASMIFMNWVFIGDVSSILRAMTGSMSAARAEMGLEPWPFLMGGRPMSVSVVMLAGLFFAFPLSLLALSGVFAGSIAFRNVLLMGGTLILMGVVTTYLGVLSHPSFLWVFAVPLSLVVLEEMADGWGGRILATLALVGGIAGGWWLLGLHPTGDLNFWRAEIGGTVEQVTGIDLNLPQALAIADRQEAALNQVTRESVAVWGAREDILREAEQSD